jgi:hypothetical protein
LYGPALALAVVVEQILVLLSLDLNLSPSERRAANGTGTHSGSLNTLQCYSLSKGNVLESIQDLFSIKSMVI